MTFLPDNNKVSFNDSGGGLVFSEKKADFSFFSDKFLNEKITLFYHISGTHINDFTEFLNSS